mmetsp:Transcript_29576/g.54939  ORF Transcript_29576/g.54939 Transcript_29576/m.54939 type:complete len:327 (-) Transcript_29576:777-1757(-)
MAKALTLNYMQLRTRGGRLSLAPQDWVVFSYMDSVVNKSGDDFESMLRNFLLWSQNLKAFLTRVERINWSDISMYDDRVLNASTDEPNYQKVIDLVTESYDDRVGGALAFFNCKKKRRLNDKNVAQLEYKVCRTEWTKHRETIHVTWHFSKARPQFVMATNLLKLDGSGDDIDVMRQALAMNFSLKNYDYAIITVKKPTHYSAAISLDSETKNVVLSFTGQIDDYSGVRLRRSHLIFQYTAFYSALKLRGGSGKKNDIPLSLDSRKPSQSDTRSLEEIISSTMSNKTENCTIGGQNDSTSMARITVEPTLEDEKSFEMDDTEADSV